MSTVFSLSSWLVLPFWLAMLVLPKWRWTRRALSSPLVCLPAAALYLALVAPRVAEVFPAVLNPSLDSIARLLGTADGATIAWAHFLAFDLFVGRWVYLDALEQGISWLVAAPVLFLTLMLGPVGLLAHLGVRSLVRREQGTGWLRRGATALDGASATLFRASIASLALLALFVALVPFDERTITGVNPWIKPAKFAISIAIYLLTVAWLVGLLRLSIARKRFVEWGLVVALGVEISLIALQAARGTTSHFNKTTLFDAVVFGVMGAMIVFAAAIAAYLLFEVLRQRPEVPTAVLWGIRIGLAIFLLANLEGFAMVAANAHTIGAPDGGPGLPVVNWSTRAGDLRVAHFLGMHAIQALPLAGYLLWRLERDGWLRSASAWLVAVGALYAAANVAVFALAMLGRPLLALQ